MAQASAEEQIAGAENITPNYEIIELECCAHCGSGEIKPDEFQFAMGEEQTLVAVCPLCLKKFYSHCEFQRATEIKCENYKHNSLMYCSSHNPANKCCICFAHGKETVGEEKWNMLCSQHRECGCQGIVEGTQTRCTTDDAPYVDDGVRRCEKHWKKEVDKPKQKKWGTMKYCKTDFKSKKCVKSPMKPCNRCKSCIYTHTINNNYAKKEKKTGKGRHHWGIDKTDDSVYEYFVKPCYWCGKSSLPEICELDRKNNDICYVHGNIVPSCHSCNTAKNDLPLVEFVEMCVNVAKQWNKPSLFAEDKEKNNGREITLKRIDGQNENEVEVVQAGFEEELDE